MDDGVIKFKCNWVSTSAIPNDQLAEISVWRNRMFKLGLIGAYPDGTGYGNISIRINHKSFIITGTGTGMLNELNNKHYSRVDSYNFNENSIHCSGPIKASSESLTHAMIYECSPETKAVIHVHDMAIWNNYLHIIPTTRSNVSYGTPDMAHEIIGLFEKTNLRIEKKLVMGGHQEGVITFGNTLDEAGRIIIEMLSHSK